MDNSYYEREKFGIIGEAKPILSKDKFHSDLGDRDCVVFNSKIDAKAGIVVAGSNPDVILDTTAPQIGIQSMDFEPETGIADLSFSTNGHLNEGIFDRESEYLIGNEFNGRDSFLEKDNAEWGLGDTCHLVIDRPMNELGSFASCNTGDRLGASLGYSAGRDEFLVAGSSLGDTFYGSKLTGEASFLGTSENTVLGVGMDSNYELGAINQVGVCNIQAENNFNLVEAGLGIGNSVNFVDPFEESSWLSGANQIQIDSPLSWESEDEFDTVLLEHPYFEDEGYKELKNIYSQFQNSMDSGNISHFMQYAEVGNKTIKIYCMNLSIYVDGDFIGSHHIGNNYTLKIESNE